ncbi:MAG: ABC transporter permease subunit [Vallitalea sp.]|nr:ABC transporter permease subunit [Vallitalea sp.]
MYQIFKLEIKRKLKSPVVWILIVIMMLLLYVNIDTSIETNEIDRILNYDPNIVDSQIEYTNEYKLWRFGKSYEDYVENKKNLSSSLYKLQLHNYEVRKKAYLDVDFIKMNKVCAFDYLLYANYYTYSERNDYGSFCKYLCNIANKELWDKVSDGVKYEDIDFKNKGHMIFSTKRYLYHTISCIFNAKRHYYLYNNNLIGIEQNEFNNLNIVNDWINSIVPIIIIIISILLNYNLINKDVKEGSTKLLITQAIPRRKYYIGKFFASTIIVIITIMIPLFISNIYIKTQIKIQPMKYPIVYDKQGIKTFKPSFNYLEKNFEKYKKC